MLSLLPADIVLVRSNGIVARGIRFFSESKRGLPSRVNHAALSVSGLSLNQMRSGLLRGAGDVAPYVGVRDLIIDAQPPRVTLESLWKTYGNGAEDQVIVYRPVGLSYEERVSIAVRGLRYVGCRYGFTKIFLHAIGFQRYSFLESRPICSYVVTVPYFYVKGWDFGVPAEHSQPDDIDDYARMNLGDKYECLHDLGRMQ